MKERNLEKKNREIYDRELINKKLDEEDRLREVIQKKLKMK